MGSHNRLTTRTRRTGVAVVAAFAASLTLPLTTSASAAAPTAMTRVIVRGQHAGCENTLNATVLRLHGRLVERLRILDGGVAVIPTTEVDALRHAPCVTAVTPDGSLKPDSIGGYDPTKDTGSLFNTTKIIHAQDAWSHGDTGRGVGVALIDTGVAPVQGLNAAGQLVNGPDLSFASQAPQLAYNDEYGHGTHLASIIAGNDLYARYNPVSSLGALGSLANTALSMATNPFGNKYVNNTNAFIGVAPDAHVVNMKVGDENGVVDVSQVIASIDWIVQHANDPGLNIKVINLSYGTTSSQAYTLDPLAYATEVAWQNGIVVVAAAGNAGNSTVGLNDPAYDPYVIAVGAADTNGTSGQGDDFPAAFSNSGDGTRNPDLLAPGVHIEGLRDPGSNIDTQSPNAAVGTRFFLGSGTSQAAAVVSGAVADYFSAHPNATPDYVKAAFTRNATRMDHSPANLAGSGELNVQNAISHNLDHFAPQGFSTSTGTGSLEAARGDLHVQTSGGAQLTGEMDIMGNAWDSTAMAQAEATTSAWNGGTFNGAAWSGAGWSGAGWSGAGWSGAGWSGAGWSGAGWSGSTWNGAGWSGSGWSGAGWSGAGWSGAGWSGAGWSGAAWSGSGWSDYCYC